MTRGSSGSGGPWWWQLSKPSEVWNIILVPANGSSVYIMAFDKLQWRFLEASFANMEGASDVPMLLTRLMHKHSDNIGRYDVTVPISAKTIFEFIRDERLLLNLGEDEKITDMCDNCGARSAKFLICSGCKVDHYCHKVRSLLFRGHGIA